MIKKCKTCGIEKELTCFNKHYTCKFGVRNVCKKCQQGAVYKIRSSIRRKSLNRLVLKMPRVKSEQAKLNKKLYTQGWLKAHPKYSTEWARKNRLKARLSWHKRNRGIKATNDDSVTDIALRRLFEEQGCKCVYCDNELVDYHIDHKTPLSRGGRHTVTNIQILCPTCNLSKARKTHDEFLNYLTTKNHVHACY
jgi:5-methylcytosine-specific restriction endonuclease McrA